MVKFITENKEWLFSGIGITVLICVFALIKRYFIRGKKETQKVELHLHSSNESFKVDNRELILKEKVNLLSFSEIEKSIEKVPPLQRGDVEKNFKGLKVMWDGYLKTASKEYNGIVSLLLAPGPKVDDLAYTIHCKVPLNDYRELGILPKGAKIRIQGEIAKAGSFDVELINVKLFFLENRK